MLLDHMADRRVYILLHCCQCLHPFIALNLVQAQLFVFVMRRTLIGVNHLVHTDLWLCVNKPWLWDRLMLTQAESFSDIVIKTGKSAAEKHTVDHAKVGQGCFAKKVALQHCS